MPVDDVELTLPVRGFSPAPGKQFDHKRLDKQLRRQFSDIERWAASPFATNAKIQSLSADKITAGTITSTLLITGLIQAPSAAGYRVEIGNATYPLRYWNGTTTKFSVDTSGNADFSGTITATGGSITGTLGVTGLIQAPTTGYRVEIGNATYPIRFWDGTNTRWRIDTSGNVEVTNMTANQGDAAARAIKVTAYSTFDTDQAAFEVQNSSGNRVFAVLNGGSLVWGYPGSNGTDYTKIRASSNEERLICNGVLQGSQGIQTIVAAGANVEDTDFSISPQNGTIAATDSGGTRRLWVRLGGTWYKTVGLTT